MKPLNCCKGCKGLNKNGAPLPEDHGRLIDADKLRAEYTKPNLVGYDEIIADIDRQPTVVEGDGVWSDK
jgi:hypothetical protein